jgi:DNA-binding CsgD family transcriptional regulator
MDISDIIDEKPQAFTIDGNGLLVRQFRDDADTRLLHGLGLRVCESRVLPQDRQYDQNWLASIRQVVAERSSRLAVVSSVPGLKFVALSYDSDSGHITVKAPMRRACDTETINEVSDLVGITDREKQVLLLVTAGYEPKSISRILGTSTSTVNSQLKSVFGKTGTNGMRDMIVFLCGLSEARAA